MPLLSRRLPFDQRVDLPDGFILINQTAVHSALEKCIHVKLSPSRRAVPEELQNAFQPPHKLVEEAIIVDVHLVDEFIEVVLVTCTEINEGLNRLIGIGGHVLTLAGVDYFDGIVDEKSEVSNGVVHVCGFVNADKRFVEDGEEVSEQLERRRLFPSVLAPSDEEDEVGDYLPLQ